MAVDASCVVVTNPVPLVETERSRLRSDLRSSVGDGAAFGLMVGLGETYLAAFVLAVGLGELVAGLIGSVPLVIGGILQMISPRAIRKLGSHKRWVVLCAAIQACMFIPLVMAALAGTISTLGVILVASIYWGASLATGPAWNTWIGTLVPVRVRPRFFASRTRISQACVFSGFLMSGLLLQWASREGLVLETFAFLFGVAGVCRLVSVWMLANQSEPVPIPPRMQPHPYRRLFKELAKGPGGRLLTFLVAVQAAVQISGPYFTPFMFKNLHHSYGEYVTLIAVAFLARIIALPALGSVAHRLGARRLLWLGAIGIAPVSAGWVLSQNFYWLLGIQIFSGVVWAAYELAFFLLFFESIPEEERTSLLTIYNLINTLAWVTGALLGGAILYAMGTSFNGYLTLFALSSVARCCALLLLFRIPKMDVESSEIGLRTITLRPNGANLDAPVLPSLPDQLHEEDLTPLTARAS